MDQAANFAKGAIISTFDGDDTAFDLETGHGVRFPATPFNAVLWNVTDYPDPADARWHNQAEVIRVTDITTDTVTATRAQEGTDGIEAGEGKSYVLIAPLTAKVINEDLQHGIDGSPTTGTVSLVMDAAGWRAEAATGITDIGDQEFNFNGTRIRVDDGSSQVVITNQVILTGLPTSNPAIAGALWNDSGTVKISAG